MKVKLKENWEEICDRIQEERRTNGFEWYGCGESYIAINTGIEEDVIYSAGQDKDEGGSTI